MVSPVSCAFVPRVQEKVLVIELSPFLCPSYLRSFIKYRSPDIFQQIDIYSPQKSSFLKSKRWSRERDENVSGRQGLIDYASSIPSGKGYVYNILPLLMLLGSPSLGALWGGVPSKTGSPQSFRKNINCGPLFFRQFAQCACNHTFFRSPFSLEMPLYTLKCCTWRLLKFGLPLQPWIQQTFECLPFRLSGHVISSPSFPRKGKPRYQFFSWKIKSHKSRYNK